MASINMEELVDHFRSELRESLAYAVKNTLSEQFFDQHQLFYAFRTAVGRRFRSWEKVPDEFVKND